MDRRRNRKNATGSKLGHTKGLSKQGLSKQGLKKYYLISFFGAMTLLFSCAQQNKLITQAQNKPHFQDHIPKNKGALSMQERFAGLLNVHNHIRASHNLPPLKWSKKLANYSLEWANHLGRGKQCQMYHRGGKPPYGENLYLSSAEVWRDQNGREVDRRISPVTIVEVVKSWASEDKWYNYAQNRCQPGKQCGHYTQIVWRDTTEVGCAMKVCPDKSQTWVCSYNPPGNFVGERPY